MADTFSNTAYRPPAELADWLGRQNPEPIVDPEQPLVDAHHHLWDDARGRYLVDDFAAEIATGHRVVATMFAQCETMYRQIGPEIERPVGETEFAAEQAALSESGRFGPAHIATGIVAYADLTRGAAIAPVVDQHRAASDGRLRAIRCSTAWDRALRRPPTAWSPPEHAMLELGFLDAVGAVVERGLVLDAWLYHPQLSDLDDLAARFPQATIVLDHCGGLVGVGPYEGRDAEERQVWRHGMTQLASRPNIRVKLGGLGMQRCGFNLHLRDVPPGAHELAAVWRPYVESCIELFGAERCMFESNFPPDKQSCNYFAIWNAFKLIAASGTSTERDALFYDTARQTYTLDIPAIEDIRATPSEGTGR